MHIYIISNHVKKQKTHPTIAQNDVEKLWQVFTSEREKKNLQVAINNDEERNDKRKGLGEPRWALACVLIIYIVP